MRGLSNIAVVCIKFLKVKQEQICYPQFSALEFLNYMALLKGLDGNARSRKHIWSILIRVLLKPKMGKN